MEKISGSFPKTTGHKESEKPLMTFHCFIAVTLKQNVSSDHSDGVFLPSEIRDI